jgi:hypothetical protein
LGLNTTSKISQFPLLCQRDLCSIYTSRWADYDWSDTQCKEIKFTWKLEGVPMQIFTWDAIKIKHDNPKKSKVIVTSTTITTQTQN